MITRIEQESKDYVETQGNYLCHPGAAPCHDGIEGKPLQSQKARRAAGERVWSFTTERIHSLTTRGVYQQHILAFVNWARDSHHITHLEQLDERADELVTAYLTHHIVAGRSPYTLQTERAALRMFFHNRGLAATVTLPARQT